MQCHYSDHFVLPLPEGHRFPMRKYRDLHDALAVALPQARFVEAPSASPGELALAHTPSYVDAVLHGHLSAAQQREIGFPWSPQMAERSRRSVGATIAAARAALHEGVSANLAGGTHHASTDAGSGFCVFNDVAVAARLMQAEWHRHHRRLLRVAVIDLDVHQGNGTAAILADDPTVWTLSLHGQHNFPFRKVASDDDVALPDGCGDADYLAALDAALDRLWTAHADGLPGLAFYNAGADVHEGDRLGRLKLTADGVAERDRRVYAALRQRGIPVAICMGGGYGIDLAQTVAVQRRTLELAWEDWHARGALRAPT
ncbi:histone deacetylase [Sphaerotilus mobilis]|uniref:Acetoin utilization deacetylase AcuC-like enzyme n=1 Tax=Sphaerotilus mobilis TaxID=47994 RepID=A0A4Q7LQL5_9BURK|nr:histone deacetylase [Sphaerotilus mobilis]RZS56621.1 acetoin utilization deacetylase AcuC-like enzyme [Sphaerotilus mobilis]